MDAIEKGQLLDRLERRAGRAGSGERFVRDLLRKYREGSVAQAGDKAHAKTAARALSDDAPRALDVGTRARMEALLGEDLGDVRIHTGEAAQHVAEGAGARAFVLNDRDIYFGRDAFSPGTAGGRALLAHELAHVAERRAGAMPSLKRPLLAHEGEAHAERAEGMALALEESAAEVAEKIVRVEQIEQIEEEGMSLDEKKRWLFEQAWQRFVESEHRQADRLGIW